jgi:hypothetical protein
MIRDFDFRPVNRLRKKPGQPPAPVPARPNSPKHSHAGRQVAPKQSHKPSTDKPVDETRSSLIDYHPLSNARVPEQLQATPRRQRQQVPSTNQKPRPALHDDDDIPWISKPAPIDIRRKSNRKKRIDKKTILSAVSVFIVIILLSSGLLFPLLQNPSVTIVLYIIAALILRLKSRVSFSIALLLLLAIPILLLMRQQGLAETYAIFCFYFLVVGVISATLELRNSND